MSRVLTSKTDLRGPDGVRSVGASYVVMFNGRLCSPTWELPGPAQAYYDALLRGTRQPEYPR